MHPNAPEAPQDWEGVDTRYGGIAHEPVDPIREYQITEDIKARAVISTARVIVFPESVVPRWTAATELFWADMIANLKNAGKVVVVGAITPADMKVANFRSDVTESLAALGQLPVRSGHTARPSLRSVALKYGNGVVIRGASSGEFMQRVPVPIGMWRPFTNTGAPLRLLSETVRIQDSSAVVPTGSVF